MIKDPLLEVFGFPPSNLSKRAQRYRDKRLCPFNNKVANCTKNSKSDPLGVCSIRDASGDAVICPVRFREDWRVLDDSAEFFFKKDAKWRHLTEVRLDDADGRSAGNIDIVLAEIDEYGRVIDFGSIEVQAVYITGNLTNVFRYYMDDPKNRVSIEWTEPLRADYLSSSRKRLAPQLLYKGGILRAWRKKQAVVVHENFFASMPELPVCEKDEADMAWLVYGLEKDADENLFHLRKRKIVYTKFDETVDIITLPKAGRLENFLKRLQEKIERGQTVAPDLDDSPEVPL